MDDVVLIVSHPHDLHAQGVASILRSDFAVAVHHLDMQAFPSSVSASFSTEGRRRRRWDHAAGGLELDNVRSVWWRRPQAADVARVFNGVDRGEFAQTECDHFLQGLLWSSRCRWVNDPMNNLRASRKVVQLARAADVGLTVPATLITNDPAEARDFIEALPGRAIYKRTGGGPGPAVKTCFVTPDVVQRLDSIVDCPTTFQSYVDGELDIRVTWIDGDAWAVSIDSGSGSSPEDSRFDYTVSFAPYELPPSIDRSLASLMTALGLVYGAIDLRLGRDGELYFLEVNPAGQFAYIEVKTGLPLMRALASVLARPQR